MPRNLVAKLTRSTNQIGKITLNGVSDAATPEEIRNYAMLFGKLFPDRVQWEAPEQTASAITIVDNLFNKATSVEPGAKVKLVSGLLGDRSPKPLFKQTVKLPAKGTKIFAILTHLLSNPGSTVTELSRVRGHNLHKEHEDANKLTNALVSAYSRLLDRVRNPSSLRAGTEVWCYSLKPEVAEAMREALKV
jgi:hypothetical protein